MGDFDWSSVFGTFGDGASDYDTSYLGDSDWMSGLNTTSTDYGSGGTDWGSVLGSIFGGSDSSSGMYSNIFAALLGGLGGMADSKLQVQMAKDLAHIRGEEDRKTLGFSADLKDYYDQKDKYRKKVALDTYGQFSLMDRYAPNYKPAAPIEVPNKPVA
jgi:hypothetical protein